MMRSAPHPAWRRSVRRAVGPPKRRRRPWPRDFDPSASAHARSAPRPRPWRPPRCWNGSGAMADRTRFPVALIDDAARAELATGRRARRALPAGRNCSSASERKGTPPYWAAARQRAEARRARLPEPSSPLINAILPLQDRMFLLGQQLGKYQILQTLGSGGFGTVYLVKDTWIDKKCAIKVPHRQGVDFGELLREPRLLAALDHKNIVRIITAEKADDYFFIVMEFVEGETLEAILSHDKVIELTRALDFS